MERFGHYLSILVAIRSGGAESGARNAFPSSQGALKMRLIGDFVFLVFFFVVLVAWLLAWAAFHIAGGAIHLLLILAVIFLALHFFRGRRTV